MIDLRTDAVTMPTEEMWEAMRAAELGWAPTGEDPTVRRLEALAAELTGKEEALFVLTGTMANLIALLAWAEGASAAQIIAEASSHIIWSEEWSYASLAGLAARTLEGVRGALDPAGVCAAIADSRSGHHPRTVAVCLENTHNAAGGAILTPEQTSAVANAAHQHGAPLHLDGARIYHAAVALDVPIRELTSPANSVMISLSKGLGAPAGAVICGPSDFIARARHALRRVGGHSMPQAGILAAAGIVALETMVERLADDHRRARALAEGLAAIPGFTVDLDVVQTNIVMVRIDSALGSAQTFVAWLESEGIRAYIYRQDTMRFVTHRHVGDDDIQQVLEAARHSPFAVRGTMAEQREANCEQRTANSGAHHV